MKWLLVIVLFCCLTVVGGFAQQGHVDSSNIDIEVVGNDTISDTLHFDDVDTIATLVEQEMQIVVGGSEQMESEQIIVREVMKTPFWLFAVLMGQLLLLAIIRISFLREVGELINAYFNLNISQQVYRDQQLSTPISGILLNLNSIISLSIFLWMSIPIFGISLSFPAPLLFVIILALMLVLYSLKYVLLKLISVVFPFGEELSLYSFNFFLSQKLLGITLIPLNLLIAYAPVPWDKFGFYAAIVIAGVLILVRSFKGFVIGKNYLFTHQFHFLLYICTLEIVPLVVVLKVIKDWMTTG